jgi:DNA-binding response OmpR family regulator
MSETASKILIIEDDASLRLGLEQGFLSEGYVVESAGDGKKGLETALTCGADLIVLDLMLPGMDGFEILRRLRADQLETPVIVLTARGEVEDRVAGFEHGADDYVVKPFSVRELLLRVAAVLKRYSGSERDVGVAAEAGTATGAGGTVDCSAIGEDGTATVGDTTVDFRGYQVIRGGMRTGLARKEAEMLRIFITSPGEVISRQRFLENVWGYQSFPTTRTVDMHVLKLRQKIEADPENPRHFLTVHGVGYKFIP